LHTIENDIRIEANKYDIVMKSTTFASLIISTFGGMSPRGGYKQNTYHVVAYDYLVIWPKLWM